MKTLALSLASGFVFAIGLGVAGMTRPGKVIAFLDVTGQWDPSLAFVMASAIAVYASAHRWTRARAAPLFSGAFDRGARRAVDARLVGGAAIFGVGWGLGGLCPGPALASLATGEPSVTTFVAAMAAGMAIHAVSERARSASAARGDASSRVSIER